MGNKGELTEYQVGVFRLGIRFDLQNWVFFGLGINDRFKACYQPKSKQPSCRKIQKIRQLNLEFLCFSVYAERAMSFNIGEYISKPDSSSCYRHYKKRGAYSNTRTCIHTESLAPMVFYQSADGKAWVRPEFDGNCGFRTYVNRDSPRFQIMPANKYQQLAN